MRWVLALFMGMLIAPPMIAGFEPGDKVVMIRPGEMQTTTGSAVPLPAGATLVVVGVVGDRLTVAAGREGIIDPHCVMIASNADAYFSELIAKDPSDAAALRARGRLRFDQAQLDRDKLDLAIADLNQSLKAEPTSEAYTYRGFAWKRKGDKDVALADFNQAIALNPKAALAWRVRGATWAGKGDYQKALADYSESIRIDPENPDSLHHRVVLQSACMDAQFRNAKQAVADATKACEVSNWKDPLYMIGYAMAHAEAGDFETAVKWQNKAIELAAGRQGQSQLELYRQGKPYRTTWR
jgi:tetratricopeptide (TPR) repeat protein